MTGIAVTALNILLTNIKERFREYGSLLLAPKDCEMAGRGEKRERQIIVARTSSGHPSASFALDSDYIKTTQGSAS